MKLKLWVATIGALLALPFAALAQQSPRQADPADPHVVVPALVYESIISGVAAPGQAEVTPDKSWRAANDAVAGTQGHASHGATATAANSHAHDVQAERAPPVKPVAEPAADHSKHHQAQDK
jgi:hypothetical protein